MGPLKWITQSFMAAFLAMIFIFIIKKYSMQYNIPVVKDIAAGI